VPDDFEVVPVTPEESEKATEMIRAFAKTLQGDTEADQPVAEEAVITAQEDAEQTVAACDSADEPKDAVEKRSSVPVMVRRQRPQRKSEKKRHSATAKAKQTQSVPALKVNRGALHLSQHQPVVDGKLSHALSDSINFEQYVREIAQSYVSEMLVRNDEPAAAEIAAPPARKHRQRSTSVNAVTPASAPAAEVSQPAEPEVTETAAAEGDEVKTSARKNRHPHQKGGLIATLLAAMRRERQEQSMKSGDDDTDTTGGNAVTGEDQSAVPNVVAETEAVQQSEPVADEKIMSENDENSDAFEEASMSFVPELQTVIDRFVECNRVPSITVVPRTIMVRRYRD